METAKRSIRIPDSLWSRAESAARKAAMLEDQRVSVSDLIRRGLREQVQQIEGGEEAV